MKREWQMKAAAIVIALSALAVASHAVQAVAEINRPATPAMRGACCLAKRCGIYADPCHTAGRTCRTL